MRIVLSSSYKLQSSFEIVGTDDKDSKENLKEVDKIYKSIYLSYMDNEANDVQDFKFKSEESEFWY